MKERLSDMHTPRTQTGDSNVPINKLYVNREGSPHCRHGLLPRKHGGLKKNGCLGYHIPRPIGGTIYVRSQSEDEANLDD